MTPAEAAAELHKTADLIERTLTTLEALFVDGMELTFIAIDPRHVEHTMVLTRSSIATLRLALAVAERESGELPRGDA